MKASNIDGLVQSNVDQLAAELASELNLSSSTDALSLVDGAVTCNPKPMFFDDMQQRYIQGVALDEHKNVEGVLVYDDDRWGGLFTPCACSFGHYTASVYQSDFIRMSLIPAGIPVNAKSLVESH